MTAFFTADSHFGHKNILDYSKRQFGAIEAHDEALVERWNAHVRPGDLVYHLGDFALCDEARAIAIVKRLTGQKYLIFGNHDKRLRKSKAFLSQWIWGRDLEEISVSDQPIVLCHFAMLTWNKSHHGAWQLHGHSHGSLRDEPHALRLDVGVDCWNYAPVPFEVIATRMAAKTFVPVDHHKRDPENPVEPMPQLANVRVTRPSDAPAIEQVEES